MNEIIEVILNATIILWVKTYAAVRDKQMLIIKYDPLQKFLYIISALNLLHPEW